jgi:hypothetical protein
MTHSAEMLEGMDLYVRLAYCEHVPTVIGETLGTLPPDEYVAYDFGPFTYLAAKQFVAGVFAGSEHLPYGMTAHDATVYFVGDDYEDEIVEVHASPNCDENHDY